MSTNKVKPKYKKGMPAESQTANYIEFGKFMINLRLLNEGELLTKYIKSFAPTLIKRQPVSKLFETLLTNVFDTQEVNYELAQDLSEAEKELFKTLIHKAGLTSILEFDPKKVEPNTKQLVEKFNVLKGEILAGNDNVIIKTQLKQVSRKLYEKDVISEEQLQEIIEIVNNI
jgi:hypothetical protein